MIIARHGVITSVSRGLLLDIYPNAIGAYSLRKLRVAYSGAAIRVRRSSDNAEQDIGFTGAGSLDESALTTFTGSNNGFITTWYDQSLNGTNAVQSTGGNQPQIVSSGVVNLQNSKPSVKFNGSTSFMGITNSINWWKNKGYVMGFLAAKCNNISGRNDGISSGAPNRFQLAYSATTNNKIRGAGRTLDADAGTLINTTTNYGTTMHIVTLFNKCADGTNFIFFNGTQEASGVLVTTGNTSNTNNGVVAIGSNSAASASIVFDGNISEVIFYEHNISSDRMGVEGNLNAFYVIY